MSFGQRIINCDLGHISVQYSSGLKPVKHCPINFACTSNSVQAKYLIPCLFLQIIEWIQTLKSITIFNRKLLPPSLSERGSNKNSKLVRLHYLWDHEMIFQRDSICSAKAKKINYKSRCWNENRSKGNVILKMKTSNIKPSSPPETSLWSILVFLPRGWLSPSLTKTLS